MAESNSVGLTEVLYGVVIANAIYELGYGLNFRNALLLFALGILVADWVEYQLSTQALELSDLRYSMMLVLDMLILLCWYLLTIVPEDMFSQFILLTGLFFGLVGVWSGAVMDASLRELLVDIDWGADWQIAITFFVLFGVQTMVGLPQTAVLGIMLIVWLGRKSPVWYRLVNRREANF
jgi:hypothetical protein